MAHIFNLPDLGEGLPDATIVKWLVKAGDSVKVDQPIAEMETAKAVVEVPSPVAGTIVTLHGKAGDVIITHAPLVTFALAGESAPSAAPSMAAPMHAQVGAVTPVAAPAAVTAGNVFYLPDLGEGLPDATIVKWLVKAGDAVKVDQPIAEMETAKAVVEVPSPYDGVIATLHGKPGDVILTHAAFVSYAGTGTAPVAKTENAPADAGTVVGNVQVGNEIKVESADAVVRALAKKLGVNLNNVKGTGDGGKITQADVKNAKNGTAIPAGSASMATPVTTAPISTMATSNPLAYRASPAVRKMAHEMGVDLSRCQTSGPKGTITRDDVAAALNAVSHAAPRSAAASVQPALSVSAASPAQTAGQRLPTLSMEIKPEPIRGVRRAMAQAMTLSHQNVVPVTLMEDANISRWKKGEDSLVRYIRALCAAARVEPALNAWFDGANMERLLHPNVNVGIAVDTPDGLYVPVVRNAQMKSSAELRAEIETLRKKIADKAIKPDDLSGTTISLSNYGSIAGRYGTPIVVPPQVAIMGCGRFRNELKLTDKGIENARMLPLSLSFDHRACTGGEGARFLAAVVADLEKAE